MSLPVVAFLYLGSKIAIKQTGRNYNRNEYYQFLPPSLARAAARPGLLLQSVCLLPRLLGAASHPQGGGWPTSHQPGAADQAVEQRHRPASRQGLESQGGQHAADCAAHGHTQVGLGAARVMSSSEARSAT